MRLTNSKTLSENHTGVIVIEADNVVLDCNYKYLYESTNSNTHICGAGKNKSCGILVVGRANPTVKRCRPRFFDYGMNVRSVSGGTFHNNRFEYNFEGVRIEDGSDGRYDINYHRYNDDEGLDIDGTSYWNEFSRSWFNGNAKDGVDLHEGANQHFFEEDNQFLDNGFNGIECDACVGFWVANSTFDGNGFGSSQPRSGLSLDDTDFAAVTDNVATNNAKDGIRVMNDSNNGDFLQNTAHGNESGCDAREDASSRNEWTDNDFENACL
jgi:parallel beta-helix repeat protein